jgi:glutaryl-CoA dehydrogenase
MKTRAEKDDGGYVLSGAKMWITNSPDRRRLRGLGEDATTARSAASSGKGMKGFSAPKIEGKISLRASITGEIVMDDVEVPARSAAAQRRRA